LLSYNPFARRLGWGGWVGGWVAGQVRLYNHTFGHPIGWVFPLGRVWQLLINNSEVLSIHPKFYPASFLKLLPSLGPTLKFTTSSTVNSLTCFKLSIAGLGSNCRQLDLVQAYNTLTRPKLSSAGLGPNC
jgi:hypothetical protein